MKDISYDDHMTEWLRDPAHAAEYLSSALEDGDCPAPALALAIERVVKARSLQRDGIATRLEKDSAHAAAYLSDEKPLVELRP